MDSLLILRSYRVMLNQWTKRNCWSFQRFFKTSFVWSLPIRQEILNVSQIGIAFHGICPPFFHPDLIATILQRCLTENFVICCNQITKIFCTRYNSANTSSARGPCDFGPLADLAISVFREVSINTVFTQILKSLGCGLQRYFMRRTGVWVSVFRNSIIHKICSEFLQPFRYVGIRASRTSLWSSFLFGFGISVGSCNNSSDASEECGSPRSCLSTRSLDTVEDVMDVEVDELEEDLGWSISCLEGVMDVKEGKREEELVDKPGNTIGTKFSALHCIRIPFFMRCGFWPLIHTWEYPCSSQSFPSDKTAAVSSRTFIVKNLPYSLT